MLSLAKIKFLKMNKINLTKDKKQYYKQYYLNNKQSILNRVKENYILHKDEINLLRRGKHKEYAKEYYINNKTYLLNKAKLNHIKRQSTEEEKEYSKKYYQENKEYYKNQLLKNKEKHKISCAKYYEKNKEILNKKHKEYYKKNKPESDSEPKPKARPRPSRPKILKHTKQNIIHTYNRTNDGCVLISFN